jgi:hypothetical protein
MAVDVGVAPCFQALGRTVFLCSVSRYPECGVREIKIVYPTREFINGERPLSTEYVARTADF